jgi:hypothetical protein
MVSAAGLAACTAVGPDFKGPPPPHPGSRYVAAAERLPSNVAVGVSAPRDPWWTWFGSPALDRTVEWALKGSPTLIWHRTG